MIGEVISAAARGTAAAVLATSVLAGAIVDLARPAPGATAITEVTAGEALEWAGARLAGGDVNGDGVADLIIGAPGGTDDRPSRRGRLYVLYGRVDGLPSAIDLRMRRVPGGAPGEPPRYATDADVIIEGADDFDHLGRSLAVADLDGDGIGDIVAGAPRADGPGNTRPDCGEVIVIYGSPSLAARIHLDRPPEGLRTSVVYGRQFGDIYGSSIAVADLGGDGRPDLIAGAPFARGAMQHPLGGLAVGEVLVVPGRALGASVVDLAAGAGTQDVLILRGVSAGDQAGTAVAVGDFDGDGAADLAVGAHSAEGLDGQRPDAGLVYLILGPRRGGGAPALAAAADAVIVSPGIGDLAGGSLAFADVDGDGRDDLAIGAPLADGPNDSRLDAGDVYLLRGRDRPALETLRPRRPDGDPERSGAPSGPVPIDLRRMEGRGLLTVHGADPGDHLGVRAAADLDRDGRAELILGAEDSSSRRNARAGGGEIRILAGRPAWPSRIDLSGREGMAVLGPTGNTHIGSAAAVADLNGDGLAEVAVGGPTAGQALAGGVWVLSGDWKMLIRPAKR